VHRYGRASFHLHSSRGDRGRPVAARPAGDGDRVSRRAAIKSCRCIVPTGSSAFEGGGFAPRPAGRRATSRKGARGAARRRGDGRDGCAGSIGVIGGDRESQPTAATAPAPATAATGILQRWLFGRRRMSWRPRDHGGRWPIDLISTSNSQSIATASNAFRPESKPARSRCFWNCRCRRRRDR
jgi:hypothetical protein